MENKTILLVEDEPFLAKVVEDSLIQKGYKVTHALDGKRGYSLFLNGAFDLLILDVMLPYTDGFTLSKQIRKVNTNVPVLFLTAKTETSDLIEGYSSGGNDYLKKPFSLEELFLRVAELLGRTVKVQNLDLIQIGKYSFSSHRQELVFENWITKLSNRESELLLLLYRNKNELTERRMTLISIWGDDSFFNTRTMDVFITRLRKHLRKDKQIEILNIRGMGYKLIC